MKERVSHNQSAKPLNGINHTIATEENLGELPGQVCVPASRHLGNGSEMNSPEELGDHSSAFTGMYESDSNYRWRKVKGNLDLFVMERNERHLTSLQWKWQKMSKSRRRTPGYDGYPNEQPDDEPFKQTGLPESARTKSRAESRQRMREDLDACFYDRWKTADSRNRSTDQQEKPTLNDESPSNRFKSGREDRYRPSQPFQTGVGVQNDSTKWSRYGYNPDPQYNPPFSNVYQNGIKNPVFRYGSSHGTQKPPINSRNSYPDSYHNQAEYLGSNFTRPKYSEGHNRNDSNQANDKYTPYSHENEEKQSPYWRSRSRYPASNYSGPREHAHTNFEYAPDYGYNGMYPPMYNHPPNHAYHPHYPPNPMDQSIPGSYDFGEAHPVDSWMKKSDYSPQFPGNVKTEQISRCMSRQKQRRPGAYGEMPPTPGHRSFLYNDERDVDTRGSNRSSRRRLRRGGDVSRVDEEENDDVFLSPVKDRDDAEVKTLVQQSLSEVQSPEEGPPLIPTRDPRGGNRMGGNLPVETGDLTLDQTYKRNFDFENLKNLPHQPIFSQFFDNLQMNPTFQLNTDQRNPFDTSPNPGFNRLPSLRAEHLSSNRKSDHSLNNQSMNALRERKYQKNVFNSDAKLNASSSCSKSNSDSTPLLSEQENKSISNASLANAKEERKAQDMLGQNTANIMSAIYENRKKNRNELRNTGSKPIDRVESETKFADAIKQLKAHQNNDSREVNSDEQEKVEALSLKPTRELTTIHVGDIDPQTPVASPSRSNIGKPESELSEKKSIPSNTKPSSKIKNDNKQSTSSKSSSRPASPKLSINEAHLLKSKTTLWQLAKKFHRRVSTKLSLRREKSRVISLSTESRSLRQSRISLKSSKSISKDKSRASVRDEAAADDQTIAAKFSISNSFARPESEKVNAIEDEPSSNSDSSEIKFIDQGEIACSSTKSQSPKQSLSQPDLISENKEKDSSEKNERSNSSCSTTDTETEADIETPKNFFDDELRLEDQRKKNEELTSQLFKNQHEMELELHDLRKVLNAEMRYQDDNNSVNDRFNRKIEDVENQIEQLDSKLSETANKLKQSELEKEEIAHKLACDRQHQHAFPPQPPLLIISDPQSGAAAALTPGNHLYESHPSSFQDSYSPSNGYLNPASCGASELSPFSMHTSSIDVTLQQQEQLKADLEHQMATMKSELEKQLQEQRTQTGLDSKIIIDARVADLEKQIDEMKSKIFSAETVIKDTQLKKIRTKQKGSVGDSPKDSVKSHDNNEKSRSRNESKSLMHKLSLSPKVTPVQERKNRSDESYADVDDHHNGKHFFKNDEIRKARDDEESQSDDDPINLSAENESLGRKSFHSVKNLNDDNANEQQGNDVKVEKEKSNPIRSQVEVDVETESENHRDRTSDVEKPEESHNDAKQFEECDNQLNEQSRTGLIDGKHGNLNEKNEKLPTKDQFDLLSDGENVEPKTSQENPEINFKKEGRKVSELDRLQKQGKEANESDQKGFETTKEDLIEVDKNSQKIVMEKNQDDQVNKPKECGNDGSAIALAAKAMSKVSDYVNVSQESTIEKNDHKQENSKIKKVEGHEIILSEKIPYQGDIVSENNLSKPDIKDNKNNQKDERSKQPSLPPLDVEADKNKNSTLTAEATLEASPSSPLSNSSTRSLYSLSTVSPSEQSVQFHATSTSSTNPPTKLNSTFEVSTSVLNKDSGLEHCAKKEKAEISMVSEVSNDLKSANKYDKPTSAETSEKLIAPSQPKDILHSEQVKKAESNTDSATNKEKKNEALNNEITSLPSAAKNTSAAVSNDVKSAIKHDKPTSAETSEKLIAPSQSKDILHSEQVKKAESNIDSATNKEKKNEALNNEITSLPSAAKHTSAAVSNDVKSAIKHDKPTSAETSEKLIAPSQSKDILHSEQVKKAESNTDSATNKEKKNEALNNEITSLPSAAKHTSAAVSNDVKSAIKHDKPTSAETSEKLIAPSQSKDILHSEQVKKAESNIDSATNKEKNEALNNEITSLPSAAKHTSAATVIKDNLSAESQPKKTESALEKLAKIDSSDKLKSSKPSTFLRNQVLSEVKKTNESLLTSSAINPLSRSRFPLSKRFAEKPRSSFTSNLGGSKSNQSYGRKNLSVLGNYKKKLEDNTQKKDFEANAKDTAKVSGSDTGKSQETKDKEAIVSTSKSSDTLQKPTDSSNKTNKFRISSIFKFSSKQHESKTQSSPTTSDKKPILSKKTGIEKPTQLSQTKIVSAFPQAKETTANSKEKDVPKPSKDDPSAQTPNASSSNADKSRKPEKSLKFFSSFKKNKKAPDIKTKPLPSSPLAPTDKDSKPSTSVDESPKSSSTAKYKRPGYKTSSLSTSKPRSTIASKSTTSDLDIDDVTSIDMGRPEPHSTNKSFSQREATITTINSDFTQMSDGISNMESTTTHTASTRKASRGWDLHKTCRRRSLLHGLGTNWCVCPEKIWKYFGDDSDDEPITRRKCISLIMGTILALLLLSVVIGLIIGLATVEGPTESPIRFVVIPNDDYEGGTDDGA